MTVVLEQDRRVARLGAPRDLLAIATWTALLVVAHWLGDLLLHQGWRTRIHASPLVGWFDAQLSWRTVPLLVVASAAVAWLPRFAARASWPVVQWMSGVGLAVWALALAFNRGGWQEIGRPMALPGHTLGDVHAIASPADFLATFGDRIDTYGTHVRAHPPGFALLLWCLDRVGLGGAQWAGLLVIAGGALAVPAVLVVVRALTSEAWARGAAPWLVVFPGALFVASTDDAFFAGVSAWGIACVVLATQAQGRRRTRLALGGGFLLGGALMLSYGLVLLALPVLAILVARRAFDVLAWAAAAVGSLIGTFALFGFWWLDGLASTRREYAESVARERPYLAFLVINLAALAVVVGPAVAAGLLRMRTHARVLGAVVAMGLVPVALAAASGLSKGEVERIWLPFAIWIVPAAAVAVVGRNLIVTRRWLAVQCAVAAAGAQCFVRTNW